MKQKILIVMSLKENPEQLCSVFSKDGLCSTIIQNVQSAFEHLQSSEYTFLIVDLDLDGEIQF